MSSEVCPFCGKSFKRLKSHLPHCKSAPNSNKTREEEARTSGKDEALDSTRSEIRKRTEPKVTARVKMATETSFSKMVDCGWSSDSAALGLSMDRFSMGQTAAAPASSMLEAEVSTEAFRKDLEPFSRQSVEKNMELTEEKATRGRGQDGGQRQDGRLTTRVLAPQSFSQVTLRELPDWLVSQSPRRPREVLYLAQRGWRWYYRRYIDVKRGGVGGVAMLLAGYCALSYAWAFPHLKRERWRKYH
uniref:ATP synthase subunit f, mitochondrial n=1 Tax=Knipowitschia caucasica TaxID=637954 RepID=A0AAV2LEG6_KNICA